MYFFFIWGKNVCEKNGIMNGKNVVGGQCNRGRCIYKGDTTTLIYFHIMLEGALPTTEYKYTKDIAYIYGGRYIKQRGQYMKAVYNTVVYKTTQTIYEGGNVIHSGMKILKWAVYNGQYIMGAMDKYNGQYIMGAMDKYATVRSIYNGQYIMSYHSVLKQRNGNNTAF